MPRPPHHQRKSAFEGLPKRQPLHPQMGGKPPEDIDDFISDEEEESPYLLQTRADLAKKRKRIYVELADKRLIEGALQDALNGLHAATQSATNALNVVQVKRRALEADLIVHKKHKSHA